MTNDTRQADVVIIGGGITGLSVARALSAYQLDVVVLEETGDVSGGGSSKANTSIVHSGFDPKPGSLKARLNVRGNRLYEEMCKQLDVTYKKTGTLVVAETEDQIAHLEKLVEMGVENGIPRDWLHIIGQEELHAMEPHINPSKVAALYAPESGYVDHYQLLVAVGENAVENGVEIMLHTRATDILVENDRVQGVATSRGNIMAPYVINAAGLFADEVASWVGEVDFELVPRRGEYYVFDMIYQGLANRPLFPTPSEKGKGILVTPSAHGNIMAGPNAHEIEDKYDTSTTLEGLEEVMMGALDMVPSLPRRGMIVTFAGIRNTPMPGKDFIIEPHEKVGGFINAAGIESPGLVSAPAIAEMVVDILQQEGLKTDPDPGFNPERRWFKTFAKMSREERLQAVEEDPRYGQIVCRCESVTEAEVVKAIHRPIPCLDTDAIKRRTLAGTGRCQGGFCSPRVISILARELGTTVDQITKKGGKSYFLMGPTKSLRREELSRASEG